MYGVDVEGVVWKEGRGEEIVARRRPTLSSNSAWRESWSARAWRRGVCGAERRLAGGRALSSRRTASPFPPALRSRIHILWVSWRSGWR
ncbi:hypothetical protein CVT26_005204 [Gymnopilus dilepis]|uniref:Uncharacterized protein n=1 Tax=Gymnopilus dilepis TaxID=231916 RepID=A0A409X4N4_9AGAR|nr:hypothetical protein CVT26_005204 [Gymnopilus dilepis]